MYIYFCVDSCFIGIRAKFKNCTIILAFVKHISFVNSKFFNIYYNINVFLLCIPSYYTLKDTEYTDIHFKANF